MASLRSKLALGPSHHIGVEKFTREIGPQDLSDGDESPDNADEEATATASAYRGWCDTEHLPLVKFLRFDNGSYAIVETDDDEIVLNENNNRHQRHLVATPSITSNTEARLLGSYEYDPIEPLHRIHQPRVLEEIMANMNSTRFVFGRKCNCAAGGQGDFYCPLEADLCRVWESSVLANGGGQRIVQCEGNMQDDHIRFLMPIGLFTMMLFLFCLCSTRRGRYAMTYLARLLLCYNEEQYQQTLRHEVDVQIRLAEIRSAQNMEPVLETRKVKAALKTQPYKQDCGMQQDCMICLADFEPGDRVGKLPCNHTFHVDCLKEWVTRKNHCPLCHAENLALPTSENTEEM